MVKLYSSFYNTLRMNYFKLRINYFKPLVEFHVWKFLNLTVAQCVVLKTLRFCARYFYRLIACRVKGGVKP